MSDIKVGDVVVYVGIENSTCPKVESHRRRRIERGAPALLVKGRCYTVKEVLFACAEPSMILAEVSTDNPLGYCMGPFRKVRKAEDWFTELVKQPIKRRENTDA